MRVAKVVLIEHQNALNSKYEIKSVVDLQIEKGGGLSVVNVHWGVQ